MSAANAAGPPPQPNAAQIQLALRKLGVVGSVLYVAAHPDDENTGLLTYLANGALLRTGYLSITRGDGGQNLIGPEQGPELGLIRTQELLAARHVDGAEQFFTRARDFGYSKSPEETLKIWGKDEILADVVWVIRRFRPDVIITRFSPEPADTHGHHTASAMLAAEAFRAAADPSFRPEQLKDGVAPWQARRLLWNRASFLARPGEDFSRYDKLEIGGYYPLLGLSTGEIAADSRSMHKSQGFGVARTRASVTEYFSTLAEAPDAHAPSGAVLGGLDFTWHRFAGGAATAATAADGLRAAADKVAHDFNAATPHASIPALLALDARLAAIPDEPWRTRKQREVRDLVLACAGLFADATAADFRVAPGGEIEVTATVVDRSPVAISLKEVRFPTAGGRVAAARPLAPAGAGSVGVPVEIKHKVIVPPDAPLTTPFWLAAPPEPGLYPVADPRDIGKPEDEPALRVDFDLQVAGQVLTVSRPVAYKWTDPVAGERYRPLEITPVVSIVPDTKVLLFPERRREPTPVTVRLSAGAAAVSGVLRPLAPEGWTVEPASMPFRLETKGSELELAFRVRRAGAARAARPDAPATGARAALRFVAEVGEERLSRGVVHLEHPHIPVQTWLADAEVQLVPLAIELGGSHIGYIAGAGDDVPASLRRVGYDVTLLGDEALRAGGGVGGHGAAGLARFDAIVVGVRAFNVNERLRAAQAHDVLMKYVAGGGTLVVQYNTNSRLGPLTTPIGPFPFEISHDRVTDESAAVTFSDLAHPLLTTPNRITGLDFAGWIQERGLYFASKWDPKYQTVLSMHDPGEKPLAGSLLAARYGKGTFVYTGLAFFRQLPAGVPGAYRLFANLMASARAGRTRGR
jgi:LmbE family N-acetylglucosaminyl deacetylase